MNLSSKKRHPLSRQIESLRVERGLSRLQLSGLSGISTTSLSTWGRTTSPTLDKFERVVRAMGYRLAIRRRGP